MTFTGEAPKRPVKEEKKEDALKINFIESQSNKPKMTKPVIVPSAVNTQKVTKLSKQSKETIESDQVQQQKVQEPRKVQEEPEQNNETNKKLENETIPETPKRGRGRPKKVATEEETNKVATPKKGRGRPKKVATEQLENNQNSKEDLNLFGLGEQENIEDKLDTLLPGFETEEEANVLPGFEQEENNDNNILPGFETNQNDYTDTSSNDTLNTNNDYNYQDTFNNEPHTNEIIGQNNVYQNLDIESLLTRDKKIVAFVGTTKNGTSFLVNNLAELFSSMGINTAILDVTKNKNSYYIYTKNEEELRKTALDCMNNLANGEARGIQVNKNLTVYTSLPSEEENENYGQILSSLVKNYSLVLLDCDFDTNAKYFENAQEIYLVQSMDILTIQPLTAFLRELKAQNILSQEKIRIVINKQARIRSLNPKVIIGGMAYYNDPSMSFMTELFNKDNVRHCEIPFDEQVYSKYLEGLVNCKISLNGYPKNFMTQLKALGNMVYPLLSNKYKPVDSYDRKKDFSSKIDNALEQMKRNY